MKKLYDSPKLIIYGTVEDITQSNLELLPNINKFIEGGLGLFASMEGL